MTIINNAVYVDGIRTVDPANLEQTYETLASRGGMAWIGLYRPSPQEMASVAAEFGLHELAVEDAISAHQRPKMERYGENLFTVLRPARYMDQEEVVEFGELHVFTGPDFVVTVRHAESPSVSGVRAHLESHPEMLRLGPEAVLYSILDRVVDDYGPVVAGLENDIDEIEDQLFSGEHEVSRRIYELSREVIEFQRAVHPLTEMIESLYRGFEKYHVDIELQRYLRNVEDHVIRIISKADAFRELLQNALLVDSTLTTARQNETTLLQNEQVKRISAWAAIFFAPTFVASVYGMNFDVMPELHFAFGYPMALGLMLLLSLIMYVIFKRKDWL
ncbi:magnesium/cobalt transporter CorA [Paenarthrobacter sp. DKR-5]|uniref:magnesium/cobalt transporter CorA n=1 Tax=Paenarthrobacter sp. DKR-5 TaxID=2835535 RepID=UPI001BDCDCDA|nr:magnesium/cobalt transporter CorA [Paenarthrobacter sp. DKR-5]MBT1002839.1 magnesium/cobalt transporter CorA [Paenarthrobacter sp. DKR-5]